MNEYLPYSDHHSIQEARVAVHFQRAFHQFDVERARWMAEADLKLDLP